MFFLEKILLSEGQRTFASKLAAYAIEVKANEEPPEESAEAARRVTDAIGAAFAKGESKKVGNSNTDGKTVFLHGNAIVKREPNGNIMISNAGWATRTTHERINGVLSTLGLKSGVSLKGGESMLNGKPWDGEWTKVGVHKTSDIALPIAASFFKQGKIMTKPFSQKEHFKQRLRDLGGLMGTKLPSKAVYEDQVPGGLGDDKTPNDFDPKLLKEGAEVELEHTYDPELAQELAIDNLSEDESYYQKLKKVEANNAHFIIRSLYQLVGNKRYMQDIEVMFEKANYSAADLSAWSHLVRDLKDKHADIDNRNSNKYWKGGF